MTNTYDLHEKAFPQVSAYVVTDNKGERVATVAFKHPKMGEGRLYCYAHIIGMPMSRGFATGYGYDKKSAAFYDAMGKAKIADGSSPDCLKLLPLFLGAAKKGDNGSNWDRALRDAGFNVLQAV